VNHENREGGRNCSQEVEVRGGTAKMGTEKGKSPRRKVSKRLEKAGEKWRKGLPKGGRRTRRGRRRGRKQTWLHEFQTASGEEEKEEVGVEGKGLRRS